MAFLAAKLRGSLSKRSQIITAKTLIKSMERGKEFGKITSTENNTSLQMKNIHSLWPALLNCIWTWVTPTKRVTLPTWSPSPPCKQALNLHVQLQLGGPL